MTGANEEGDDMNRSSNLNMYLPEGTDYRDVSQLTANFSTLDGSVGALAAGMAIVSVGNTHAAIAPGQYVYIMNHASLSEGMYTATTSISANTTLSGSNVTAVSGGGLNNLDSKIATSSTTTGGAGCTLYKFGKVVSCHVVSQTWKNTGAGTQIYRTVSDVDYPISIPSAYRPQTNVEIREALNGKRITIATDGTVTCGDDISSGASLRFSGCWITA